MEVELNSYFPNKLKNAFVYHNALAIINSKHKLMYNQTKEELQMGGFVGGIGTSTAAILVLFILLVIISKTFIL
jgi:hypothetical protein